MLNETGFEFVFHHNISARKTAVDVAMDDLATHKNIVATTFVNCVRLRALSLLRRSERRKLLPGDRKISEVKRQHGGRLAYHRGDRFTAETRFARCKHWLIRKVPVHAKTISAWNVFRREYRVDSWMILREPRKIAKGEGRAVQRAPYNP
jgi:hypothetical protein